MERKPGARVRFFFFFFAPRRNLQRTVGFFQRCGLKSSKAGVLILLYSVLIPASSFADFRRIASTCRYKLLE